MLASIIWTLALGASAALPDLWPCSPGLELRYRVIDEERDTGIRITETTRGPKDPKLCVIDRRTDAPGRPPREETFVIERLEDRILYAGLEGALTAFRPPVLRAPLSLDAAWTFNGVRYRVSAVDEVVETFSGRIRGCVRVDEAAVRGRTYEGWVVYAPGLGPVIRANGRSRTVLERVRKPSRSSEKSSVESKD